MKRMAVILLLAAAAATAVLAWRTPRESPEPAGPYVTVGKTHITVEIADTPELRNLGLSGRPSLSDGSGLLFVYDEPGPRAFWMKDMRFAIDIIWIGGDLTVTGVTRNALPSSYPETFSPGGDALHVLEVNAGFSDRHGIGAGDSVVLHLD